MHFSLTFQGGGADSYLPVIDFAETFGKQWGLRLKAGSADRLVIRINDNLSAGLDTFNAIGYGTKF